MDSRVSYYASTFAGTVYVTRDGKIVYSLQTQDKQAPPGDRNKLSSGWTLTETLIGGKSRPQGGGPTPTHVSYFIGDDPACWKGDVATYDSVTLGEVWPGVDVRLRAYGRTMEKLFTVHPGAKPSRIRVHVGGARSLRVDAAGALVATTGLGDIAFTPPVAYQETAGARHSIEVAYEVRGDRYGFRLGRHDPQLPIVIDPILQATYLGGSGQDAAEALAIHPLSGEVYVAGVTDSSDFPGTTGGAQPQPGGDPRNSDAFVARLNADLTQLTQASYLGGNALGRTNGLALAIHPTSGEIYVTGFTESTDFPHTTGGAQPTNKGSLDAFVARMNADLTELHQATYVGGSGVEEAHGIAIAPTSGNVYVVGETSSTDLPGTNGGAQPTTTNRPFVHDAFVAVLNAELTTLDQATYLGGDGDEFAFAVAVHPASGEIYVAGFTTSVDFPGTAGGAQASNNRQSFEAFVARLSADLSSIRQATYLGGSSIEGASALAIQPTSGEVYVAGSTDSTDFPHTTGGAQPTNKGSRDAFVARLSASLTSLDQATYLGGSGFDQASSLALHPTSGEVYVAGETRFTDFPGTAFGAQAAYGGGSNDAFVARLNADLTTLKQSTYLGGAGLEQALGLAISPASGEIYTTGGTFPGGDFPGTAGGAQPATAGGGDAFVARLTPDLKGTEAAPPTITGFSPTKGPVGTDVVITGTNFSGARLLTFNLVLAAFTVDSPTRITATVPAGATTGPIEVTTPGGTVTSASPYIVAPTVVNGLVALAPLVVSRSSVSVPGGPAGTMTIGATFTNKSSSPITSLFFVVTRLSGGNLLLNADGGPGAVGAKLTPDVGADGVLAPGEAFTTSFVVGLQSRSGFSFLVDLWGEAGP